MNICMFTNTYLPHVGGVARSVQFFTEDLTGMGHRILVVAPSFPKDTDTAGNRPEVVRVPALQHFNGSDFSVRIPLPYSDLPENALVIGHIGRLAPEKNLAYLAEAVAIFMERAPEVHFLVVGDGPAQSEIKQTFADRHLVDRLHLAGEANGSRLRDAYSAMDLFAFSSKSETQGRVLVEAMAAGKPVIALDASGSREVIQDGENGRLLSEDASAEDFAAAIRTYRDSPDLMQIWKAGALRTVQQFSRETTAGKMEALYQRLFGSKDGYQIGGSYELGPLDALTDRIKTGWQLWRRKTAAALNAVQSNPRSSN